MAGYEEYQKVNLVGITMPELDMIASAEDLISYCARVSNPTNQTNFKTSGKLLKYLADNNHWSPFEMAHVVMEIVTTRDIGRQILRHRSFSFQEYSQRYAEVDKSFMEQYNRDCRLQDTKNRQNSIETDNPELLSRWIDYQKKVEAQALEAYNWALQNGIAKELARSVLPEGLTMSRMYMAGSLRSWIHYINVREENGTQKEHSDISKKAKNILIERFEFLKNGLVET